MRPLTLTIEGLRSFRNRVQIDFEEHQLLAIVGDTGVGKSSLLEAITYALYSGATWTAHNTGLISDTGNDMLVELTFLADDKTYTVTRSNSRTRPATATAKLYCHEDDHTVDNVRTVNAEVERLIGLDRDTFLKSVILPQGRFAALLTSTPGERNEVLRNIFRVDVLDAVRDAAKTIRDRVFPHVEGLKQRLAALPDDPTAELREAKLAKKQAAALVKVLTKARTEANACETQRRKAVAEADKLQGLVDELENVDTSAVANELADITKLDKELAREQASVEKKVEKLKARRAQLEEKRAAETADGLDEKALTRTQSALKSLAEDIPALTADVDALAIKEKQLAVARPETAEAVKRVAALAADREKAKTAAKEATAALRGAEEKVRDAEDALADAAEAAGARAEAEGVVREAEERLALAEDAAVKADAAVATAEAEADEAGHELSHARRRNAAAVAAEGASAGDPCPVCDRDLPSGFRPPPATGLTKAKDRSDKAAQVAREAAKKAAAAEEAVGGARERLTEAKKRLASATKNEKKAASEVAAAFGRKAVDLSKPAAQLLKPLRAALDKARAADEQAATAAENAAKAESDADRDATARTASLKGDERRVGDLRNSCQASLKKIEKAVSGLPEVVAVDLGPLSSPEAIEPTAFVVGPVAAAHKSVNTRLARLEKLDKSMSAASVELDGLSAELDGLDGRIAEVVTRQEALGADMQEHAATLKSVSDRLSGKRPAIRVSHKDLAATVQAIETERKILHERAEAALVEQAGAEREAAVKLGEILDSHDVQSSDDLAEYLNETRGAERDATKAVKEAEACIAAVKKLDEQLGVGGQLVDDLDDLRKFLSGFTSDVLSRRSQALLAVAAQRLSEITGDRFAFTAEFEVLDKLTGQPRGAETLSGGESFLASLSLALGMVDLAARAGGRLDALFLDEGFGALDNVNLNAAIDALEATSEEGRMVAVISHVKAIADRIEDVLLVVGGVKGSRAVWLDDAKRAEISEHDVAAAMRGLLE